VNCDNITVSSQILDIECKVGIELLRCTNCNVNNNNISRKHFGVYSLYSESTYIQENLIKSTSRAIKLDQSDNNNVNFNIINYTINSIDIDESNKNIVSFNKLINGDIAIYLYHSNKNVFLKNDIRNYRDNGFKLLWECHRNEILNNTIDNCFNEGIIIFGTGGIWWDSASIKNIISGNEIKNNKIGITLDESAITKVYKNNIFRNKIGVEVISARFNKIFENNIFENEEEDAILMNSFSSRFDRNFWNESKKIHIIKGGIYSWDVWGYCYHEILPLPRFDFHAVKEPFDIGV
jgi:parallel beta-helix repeat protein